MEVMTSMKICRSYLIFLLVLMSFIAIFAISSMGATPTIIVNYAGNPSEIGGPYYRPPGEATPLTGDYAQVGYCTNDSYQYDGWMYINCTITDAVTVYLNWLNDTTWTNDTYALTNTNGNYWEINTSGNLSTAEGHNYSFNINATNGEGTVSFNWTKTGLGNGPTVRRYVHLNCTQVDITYTPLYLYRSTEAYSGSDATKNDRYRFDQQTQPTRYASGMLRDDLPSDAMQIIYSQHINLLWYEEGTSIVPFILENIYYHMWWSSLNDEIGSTTDCGIGYGYNYVGFWQNDQLDEYAQWQFDTTSAEAKSAIVYDDGVSQTSNDYNLLARYQSIPQINFIDYGGYSLNVTNFSDNNIYQFTIATSEPFQYPAYTSNRSMTSFILINLPDNTTLQGLDTDSDNLNDYDELFTHFTNPFLNDTDGDSVTDYYEYMRGTDPNNYTDFSFDTTPPVITVNYAGNLSDSGGPLWRPPSESVGLTGDFANGYYVNDSMQSEDYIYVNVTAVDAESDVDNVWLQWMNETTWTNWTYALVNTNGDYWDINTSGLFSTQEGHNYSFNIVANNSDGYSDRVFWNKTGIGNGPIVRRYVQLNCTLCDIAYTPLYPYRTLEHIVGTDGRKNDRYNRDQITQMVDYQTGFLKHTVPSDTMQIIYGQYYNVLFYDNDVCTAPFTLDNIYYHIWWSSTNNYLGSTTDSGVGYGFSFVGLYNTGQFDKYAQYQYDTSSLNSRSDITYNDGIAQTSDNFHLETHLQNISGVSFVDYGGYSLNVTDYTDNNIYQFTVAFAELSAYPDVINNRSMTSFILVNVPDSTTLQGLDTDGDTINDYDELYVYYTNPFLSDTDNDGATDYWEILANSDPNDYTENLAYDTIELTNPLPANGSKNIYQPILTSIDYEYYDTITTTLNWSVYLNSAWYQYATDTVTTSQTLSHYLPGNITTPQQIYYWRINASSSNGNYSNVSFNFTYGGAVPPSNIVCTRNGSKGIDLTFDKMDNASGTAYTVCYYQEGTVAPNYGSGTFGGNTTAEILRITGLDEETCYSFGLWTNFYDGSNWTLSAKITKLSCCTTGTNYTISFRYENTSYATGVPVNALINLSNFDADSSHRLTITFTNGTQRYIYYNSTTFADDGYEYVPTYVSSTVLSFELWWNYTEDICNSTCSYRRTLLPASSSDTNITFYLITDRFIVDEYHYENCTSEYNSYFNGSLAKYIYQFVDTTALFTGQSGYYTYATIWKTNGTGVKMIIHQDYIDISDRVYLTLLYDEYYKIGVNSSYVANGYLYEDIGVAPTTKTIDPDFYEVIIKPYTDISVEFISNIGNLITTRWTSTGTGLYVIYYDGSFLTSIVNCTITRIDTDTIVYYYEIENPEYTFNYTGANQSLDYEINITVTLTTGYTGWFVYTFSYAPDPIGDVGDIDDVFEDALGDFPVSPYLIIIFSVGIVIFSVIVVISPAMSAFGVGIWLIGANFMFSLTAFIGPGVFLIILAFMYYWLHRGDKR